jgi:hypothetical protein
VRSADRDRDHQEALRRSRLHYARDINDQRTLAAEGADPIRRGRHWGLLAVAVVVLAVLALVGRRDLEVPIEPDCGRPAIAVASSQVTAGAALRFRLTGADDTRYVVILDGDPVRGGGDPFGYTATPAGPALELQQCLSPTLVVAAPAGNGPHRLALLEVGPDGEAVEVTAVTVTVVGGR